VPLGIAYIASYLREKGVEVELMDCVVEGYYNDIIEKDTRTFGLSDDEIKKRIRKSNPDFVGISCLMTAQKHNALRVCDLVKEVDANIQTIMGGNHPSVFPTDILADKNVDHVVIGEGEYATLSILQKKEKGIVRGGVCDVNELPWPARDLLPMDKYIKINMPENIFSPYDRVTQIATSRGCPFHCVFCCTTNTHGAWRGRKWEDIIEEII